ncbi:DsrE family protein [Thiorhodovibrio frisius]|uniref:DsrE family protein n=1 Tax=Thiorhodovibrio frisius TaxID=631362 RepID=UPI00022C6688|nr:DsrE family protein [Thiorhodovibrio frisius]WPL24524.1 hypothetical protein Thiofri_04744 [Thiorhodovibrio frisius]
MKLKLLPETSWLACRAVLKDQAYKARFGSVNPNVELLGKLKDAGVKLYVCGQAIVDSGY